MKSKKVVFNNKNGESLYGRLDLPLSQKIHNYAIFAHCFTCNKNLKAVRNISQSMTNKGFGVLRFDFTGLGQSEGEFEDTNFSHNVEDLIAASNYLDLNYKAPSLIVGHSLGGTASLFAANQLSNVLAVATIGSPYQPEHVSHLLKSKLEEIELLGKAIVNIGGRNFTVKKDFIDDIENNRIDNFLNNLKKPYLILHSPQDTIVGIQNAELMYKNARHPKSFISLDGADHLLSNSEDSKYVGDVISSWAKRYLPLDDKKEITSDQQVVASLDYTDDFTTDMILGHHNMIADEPENFGGQDLGPNPYEYLAGALAACTAMTIMMYAKRKKWVVENVEVHITHSKEHCLDCEHIESKNSKIDRFDRKIKFKGDLSREVLDKLLKIADKCPVHRTMHSDVEINTELMS